MDSHLLVVPPVSSSSKMSETKMNPTLRELARCVAALSERRRPVTTFPGFQRDTHRDTLREKTSICYLYSVLILSQQWNACDRASNRMRTGGCGGRRVSCSLSSLPTTAGRNDSRKKTRVVLSIICTETSHWRTRVESRAFRALWWGVSPSLLTATKRVFSRENYYRYTSFIIKRVSKGEDTNNNSRISE